MNKRKQQAVLNADLAAEYLARWAAERWSPTDPRASVELQRLLSRARDDELARRRKGLEQVKHLQGRAATVARR